LGSAVAASWSPAIGPAKRQLNIEPTAPKSSAKPCYPPASSPQKPARMAATVKLADGLPRFEWTDSQPDPGVYATVILRAVVERKRWRAQYDAAKTVQLAHSGQAVDSVSATGLPPAMPSPSYAPNRPTGEARESANAKGHL
jgi:hypothetical protein